MRYQVKITAFAAEVLSGFHPDIKKAARSAMKKLAEDPFVGKELHAELSGFWTLRFQRYRVVYRVDVRERKVIVWAVGHRRDIYQALNQFLLNQN